jgi:DNA-binding MarR family transcriptional regulator
VTSLMTNVTAATSHYDALLGLYDELQSLLAADERFARDLAGVNSAERRVLLALAAPPGTTPFTAGQLAQRLGMDRPKLTGLIDGLERRGLVVRSRDRGDRRRILLTLTPSGAQWLAPLVEETCRRLVATGPVLLRTLHDALAHAATQAARPSAPVHRDVDMVAWRTQDAQVL